MTAKQREFKPTLPSHQERLDTLDWLGAPWFYGLPCSNCGAPEGEYCTGLSRLQYAHQARIDQAMRIAYGQEEL